MSYRRDGHTAHRDRREWEAWKREHADLLRQAGLPDGVLRSRRDWQYLVRYGYWCEGYYGKFVGHLYDFGLEQLTSTQLDAFRELLTRVLNDEEKRRGSAGWHWVHPPGT